MKFFLFLTFTYCVGLFQNVNANQIFVNAKQIISRRDPILSGCTEPTEPFSCPGSDKCISLQFICDGIEGDCPDNYDEDPNLCTAYQRPPADTIIRFLSVQYTNNGDPFIFYLFGKKAVQLFRHLPPMEAFGVIAKNLAVSRTLEEFAVKMEMSDTETKRLHATIEKVNTGQLNGLPTFITNSVREGLSSLVDNLVKTNFIS